MFHEAPLQLRLIDFWLKRPCAVNPLTGTFKPQSTGPLYGDWYTGRWLVGCYIWYSEERPRRAATPPCPLLAVPNVTAHPSTAGVPTSDYPMWQSIWCAIFICICCVNVVIIIAMTTPVSYKSISIGIRSWPASCSTLASYHKCCQHNGRWLLTTDYDRRTPLTTGVVWRHCRRGGHINNWTYFIWNQNLSPGGGVWMRQQNHGANF